MVPEERPFCFKLTDDATNETRKFVVRQKLWWLRTQTDMLILSVVCALPATAHVTSHALAYVCQFVCMSCVTTSEKGRRHYVSHLCSVLCLLFFLQLPVISSPVHFSVSWVHLLPWVFPSFLYVFLTKSSGQIVKPEQGERFPLLPLSLSLPFPFSLSLPSLPSPPSLPLPSLPLEVGP